jgi:hypothetical protein
MRTRFCLDLGCYVRVDFSFGRLEPPEDGVSCRPQERYQRLLAEETEDTEEA